MCTVSFHNTGRVGFFFQSCNMGLAHVNIDVVMASYMISGVVEGNATGMASVYPFTRPPIHFQQ